MCRGGEVEFCYEASMCRIVLYWCYGYLRLMSSFREFGGCKVLLFVEAQPRRVTLRL